MQRLFSQWAAMGDGFLQSWFLFLLCFLAAGFGIAVYLFFRGKLRLSGIAFVIMLYMGVAYSFVLPPLSAPDEVLHYVGAYELSSRMLFRPSPLRDAEGRLRIRAEDVFLDDWPEDGDPDNATVTGMHLARDTYRELHRRGLFSSGEAGYHYTLQEPVRTMPLAYFLPALGFTLARLLRLGGFGIVFLGRLMNLLFFSAMLWLSIRRTPVGKELFLGVSLFPMVLELVSSLSYDTYILGLSFYLSALVLDLGLSGRRIRKRDIAEVSILAVLLPPCKMVYAVLFLWCLLIPIRRWKRPRDYALSILLVAGLIVLSVLLFNFREFFRYANVSAETANEAEWAGSGEAAETYSFFMFQLVPDLLYRLIRNTFQIKGTEYLLTMVGNALGHLDWDLTVPVPFVCFYYGAVCLLAIFGTKEEPRIHFPQRLVLFLLMPLLILLMITIMLTAYTPKDTGFAMGVQGRYFLPALPMFLMAFRGRVFAGNAGDLREWSFTKRSSSGASAAAKEGITENVSAKDAPAKNDPAKNAAGKARRGQAKAGRGKGAGEEKGGVSGRVPAKSRGIALHGWGFQAAILLLELLANSYVLVHIFLIVCGR